MKTKGGRRIWWWLSIFVVAGAAILVGYYMGLDRGQKKRVIKQHKNAAIKEKDIPRIERKILSEKDPAQTEEIKGTEIADDENDCDYIEKDVQAFFNYIDKQKYIQDLERGLDTYDLFKKIIVKLSAQPPVPAGEGINAVVMTRNIYYFFHLLDKKELRLIREIIRNESGTLELNLELFYRWLMLGDHCPDREGIRPAPYVLYQFAGFFLNTIGGRSYLFRRPTGIRLLVSYYCLLIIHEADKTGGNSYGIDIFPDIAPLAREISTYPDFHFQNEYINRLTQLQNYYLKKR
ncbi:MAG: hypothetical protein SV375_21100 [Thermodesulfobacteriota bacterium]|nr:hypothetical protein [Thermodesulfobacteriota bacterium]